MDDVTLGRRTARALIVAPRQACEMLNIGLTHCYELISGAHPRPPRLAAFSRESDFVP
jgi:hypothetical protein